MPLCTFYTVITTATIGYDPLRNFYLSFANHTLLFLPGETLGEIGAINFLRELLSASIVLRQSTSLECQQLSESSFSQSRSVSDISCIENPLNFI